MRRTKKSGFFEPDYGGQGSRPLRKVIFLVLDRIPSLAAKRPDQQAVYYLSERNEVNKIPHKFQGLAGSFRPRCHSATVSGPCRVR